MFQSNKSILKNQNDPPTQETISRQVRIVITNSKDKGDLRGTNTGGMAEKNENESEWTTEAESKPRGGLFSFLSSKKVVEKEDLISVEEADDGSVETGLSKRDSSKYDTVEVQNKQSKGGLLAMFSSKKLVEKEDLISVDEADNGSVEAGLEKERNKYDVNALRVPSMMDRAEEDMEEEEDEILKDPYADISPRTTEPMMKDEEEEEEEEMSKSDEQKRFLMGLTSKMFFLAGSVLFLVLATHDFQRVKGSAPANRKNIPQVLPIESGTTDDDVDPFVVDMSNSTTNGELEEDMAMAEAEKAERAGGALVTQVQTHEWNTRRRAQTNWYTQYWDALPDDVKTSAELLGYDQGKWDNEESVYTDRLHWDKLTPEQQAAAFAVFGYVEATWNDFVDRFLANLADTLVPSTGAPTSAPTFSPTESSTDDAGSSSPGTPAGAIEGNAVVSITSGNDGEDMGGISGTQNHETAGGTNDETKGTEPVVSAFNDGYSVNIMGEYPSEPRGKTFKIFNVFAAVCFMMVGILDAMHQQLGFHVVMVLAGITGIMAGAFSPSNEMAFNVCHSLSSHFLLLQSVLVIYSRLLLTYDTTVRRVLNFADGLFLVGALMNVVVSYMRYDGTTLPMAKTSVAACVLWCVAAIIYVAITVMFWLRRNKVPQAGTTTGEVSYQDGGCEISLAENGGGDCEVSLADGDVRRN